MRFTKIRKVSGAWLLEWEKKEDTRGFFARTFCIDELHSRGLVARYVQHNFSFNRHVHVVRGLHFQNPFPEVKIVTCGEGRIYDVLLDVRPSSPTYLNHYAITLDSQSCASIYIPTGVAHGYQTLVAESAVHYLVSEFYHPSCARTLRWNDPAFGIPWPESNETKVTLSTGDRHAELFKGTGLQTFVGNGGV